MRLTISRERRPPSTPVVLTRRADRAAVWTLLTLGVAVIAALLAILGPPQFDLHGPLHRLGVMDPLCGGTRSVYLTLHGRLREALHYNPAGPALVVLASAVLARAAVGRVSGYWLRVHLSRRVGVAAVAVALIALDVNQQLHAALLTQPWVGP